MTRLMAEGWENRGQGGLGRYALRARNRGGREMRVVATIGLTAQGIAIGLDKDDALYVHVVCDCGGLNEMIYKEAWLWCKQCHVKIHVELKSLEDGTVHVKADVRR